MQYINSSCFEHPHIILNMFAVRNMWIINRGGELVLVAELEVNTKEKNKPP